MLFNFRHVVRDVVHLAQFVVFDLAYQNLVETLPYQVCQQLAIGEREVRGTRHGMEVCLALLRVEWRANQFAVRQCNPVILYGFLESAHVVFADLVAKTSGAAVNLHGNIAGENTEPGSNRLIVDFNNFVYFDEVVPGSQRPELVPPTLAGTIGNKRSIRSGIAAELLRVIQVFTRSGAIFHHPARSFVEHAIQLVVAQMEVAMGANAAGAIRIQRGGDVFQVRVDLVNRRSRYEESNTTVNVIAVPSGRNHSAG